jgi:diguanylate cyclase (GGDEF)-like protein
MILYANIKSFKVVNDIFGNEFGDYAIRCFAEKIKKQFTPRCVYGRLGGANFGFLVPKDEFDADKITNALSLINERQAWFYQVSYSGPDRRLRGRQRRAGRIDDVCRCPDCSYYDRKR